MRVSLKETYFQKKILLLGGLGFVGKVLLVMLLQRLPTTGQIYLLVRGKKGCSAKNRFQECIESSPIFASVSKESLERVTLIEGDTSLPNLGIEEKLALNLKEEIDLVINSSGLVDFNPDLRDALGANFHSVQNTAQFVIESKKSTLLHISTCYVAGNKSDTIPEAIQGTVSPNGKPFNLIEEIGNLRELIEESSLHFTDEKLLKAYLSREGQKRAQEWGWPNTYTYTKAMGESWLELQRGKLRFTIVRPSIVESTLAFPFPGWIEGYNTVAPLAYIAGGWYPFVLGDKDHPVDMIPVDILSSQILTIGAALLINAHKEVYQCASSNRNQLQIELMMILSRKWHRKAVHTLKGKIKTALKLSAIHPDHPFSTRTLYQLLSRIPSKIVHRFRFLRKLIKRLHFISQIHETYLPFSYYNRTIFISKHIDEIEPAETEFQLSVDQIDWADYWINVQMPGLNRWCFSQLEK